MLANLLDNAVKYTPAGGRVEHRRATATSDARRAHASRDTGIGIPADELPRIWERLYRGDKSRSERGLGLGLSLVKAIVEAHGGAVERRIRSRAAVRRLHRCGSPLRVSSSRSHQRS